MNNCAVIGSGGREQAMAWKLAQSKQVETIYIYPGNGLDSHDKICSTQITYRDQFFLESLKNNHIELIIIGPEQPLTEGLADDLRKLNYRVIGPSKNAAKLEGSKIFSKKLMDKYQIPTAKWIEINKHDDIHAKLQNWPKENGYVVKSDALAAGKGVVLCEDSVEAEKYCNDFLHNSNCVVKTDKVLIEETLIGKEYSFFALCNGKTYKHIGIACDYKRVGNGNTGPNTGGMGGYIPHDELSQEFIDRVYKETVENLLIGLKKDGIEYSGFLFVGIIMKNEKDYHVLEYNIRMGDPETQILFPILQGDLYQSCIDILNNVGDDQLRPSKQHSVHVVLASENYPSIDGTPMVLNQQITLPENDAYTYIFGAGIKKSGTSCINSGGRVLGVTGVADTKKQARSNAYSMIQKINFEGVHYRTDIAD